MASKAGKAIFKVFDQKPEKHSLRRKNNNSQILIQSSKPYQLNKCTEVLQTSVFPSRAYYSDNGFVRAVIDCYNKHHNLVLRPDDLWAAIMTQFSLYINKSGEEFRGKFVNFDGQRELVIECPGPLRSAQYDLFVKLLTKKIDENISDQEVKEWVLPNFSTTTDSDLVSVGGVFVSSMKKYFTYTCNLRCGMPLITLEGSVEDWKNIYIRLGKLKDYKLGDWYSMLEPIMKEFVNAREGNVDLEFWQKICHYRSGSGPAKVSGWITAFCVFDEDGKWRGFLDEIFGPYGWPWPSFEIGDIPSGSVEVDVKIKEDGGTLNSVMFAGHMAAEVMEDGRTLKPCLGWAIALKPEVGAESEKNDSTGGTDLSSKIKRIIPIFRWK